jgi:hypothetical protein
MTSLEIAELTGKQHNDMLKAIRKMEPAWTQVTQGNFSLSTYQDSTGRSLPCYVLTKTECLYIATKFNDEAHAELVRLIAGGSATTKTSPDHYFCYRPSFFMHYCSIFQKKTLSLPSYENNKGIH